MNIRTLILSSALLVAVPLFARENTDVLVMKNGDRMTCQVKGLDTGVLYVSFDYIDGTTSVQWSKVARLESKQLFIVKTQDGSVYTGRLNTPETPAGQPVKIQVVETPDNEVVINSSQIVKMGETSEKFWQRFNGEVNWGIIYSKGNQSTQYSLGSQTEYLRERWSAQANFSSTLSSSSGVNASTRNNLQLSASRLLPWNNYFYSGIGNFLQSSEQGITLQIRSRRWYRTLFKEHQPREHLGARGLRLGGHGLQAVHRSARHAKPCCCHDCRGCEAFQV